MGSEVCRAVLDAPDLELSAAIDPSLGGIGLREATGVDSDLIVNAGPESIVGSADVAVDFTHLEACRANLKTLAANGIHAVVGTSGFTEDDHASIADMFDRSNCLIAPNFAVGAVLMMRFAELAAPLFETAEIIELHHDGKIDAPSGTSIATAERMARASSDWAEDPTVAEIIGGARGARGAAGIPIHSVRMRGLTAHQEVVLGTAGQTLTLRHDSFDRSSFMPGVVLACRRIGELPGLTIGLDEALGL